MVTRIDPSELLSPEEIEKEINKMTDDALDNATDSSTTRSTAKEPPKNPKSKKEFTDDMRRETQRRSDKNKQREKDVAAYQSRQMARDQQIEGLGKRGGVSGLGLLGAAADGFFTYQAERAEDPNGSKVVDGMKAGLVAGAWLVAEPVMWGLTLAGAAVGGGKMLYEDAQENYDIKRRATTHVSKDESGSNKGTLGGRLIDNEYAATSRQRQEQIMRNHKISTESILGSEARQLHR